MSPCHQLKLCNDTQGPMGNLVYCASFSANFSALTLVVVIIAILLGREHHLPYGVKSPSTPDSDNCP